MSVFSVDGNELEKAFNSNGWGLFDSYNANGSTVFASDYVPELTLLNSRLASELNPDTTITPQGFAAYGDYYFQFFTGDNKIRIFNSNTYELVAEFSATDIKHGNTMQFGPEVQEGGFPFLYVSEWGDSGSVESKQIDVLGIDLSGYETESSFTLPNSAGYHPAFIGDWGNGVGYSVGFANSLSTAEEQPEVITKYRLSDMTVLEQYQVPYLGVLNGFAFYDGKLIYCGNTWNGASAIFSFIDVVTHQITQYTFPKTTNEEYEGFSVSKDKLIISGWIYDSNDGNKLKYRIYRMNLP